MKMYVAGSWLEQTTRARPIITRLKGAGVTITHDWTTADIADASTKDDAGLPVCRRKTDATNDFKGVVGADLLWLLAPDTPNAYGSWVELGLALASGIPTIVSGANIGRSIFTELATARFMTDEEAFHVVLSMNQTLVSNKGAVNSLLHAVRGELERAMVWPAMNSAHEGFAVLHEEVDELWDHVKTNQNRRDLDAMKTEAIQVAAMATRFAVEVCNEERGRR